MALTTFEGSLSGIACTQKRQRAGSGSGPQIWTLHAEARETGQRRQRAQRAADSPRQTVTITTTLNHITIYCTILCYTLLALYLYDFCCTSTRSTVHIPPWYESHSRSRGNAARRLFAWKLPVFSIYLGKVRDFRAFWVQKARFVL